MVPKISVVTPSYNQGSFIERTICSVLDQNYPNFEYIIIDGGSTDESLKIIRKYAPRLSYWVSEPDNGQSHAINKGLAKATGDIFNWLNSDDYLEPGALQRIAEAWRENPNAAAWVGACRRVTPDGQEINVIFPNNLSRSNMGENWNGRQFYQPACFMNTSAMKKLGGVNESLDFCMDLDLWLRLAKEGKFVSGRGIWANATIHPDAKTQKDRVGMHFETAKLMISHGFPEGGKNRYESNFLNKVDKYILPAELKKTLNNDETHNTAVPFDGKGKKMVMISDFMPRFDASSSQLRVSHLVKILATSRLSIDYLYFAADPKDSYYANTHQGDVRFHYITNDPNVFFKKIQKIRPEILWITNIWTTQYLQALKKLVVAVRQELPSIRIILDTMDYHAKKYFRKYKTSRKIEDLQTAQEFSDGERFLYPLGHDIITVTDEEKKDIEQEIPNCPPVSVIPNVHVVGEPSAPFESRNGIVFLGNFAVNHNYDAMEFFMAKIWPHVVARRKDISLHVVGREAEVKLAHLASKNIFLHGYVRELDAFLEKFRVFACPMTYGAGMKGKIGSALSCGLPVVTTSIGAEGFPLEDGKNCFIADDPEEFALKCLHLYDDPICWNNFSIKSRVMVIENSSVQTVSRKLFKLLRSENHKQSTMNENSRDINNSDIQHDERNFIGNGHVFTTIEFFKTAIQSLSNPFVAEVGVHLGETSLEFARIMNGKGELHIFDYDGVTDSVRKKIFDEGYMNVYVHSNSRKIRDSYNWSLMKILKNQSDLRFDYIYIDGAHTWDIDGFAFYLSDLLLKVGGYLDFDDYEWSHASSPTCNPKKYPKILELYSEEQIMTSQVKLVVDLLVRKNCRYKELVPNKIFQKIAHSCGHMN